ncbi:MULTISPECIES: DMT family transporter [unclassified Caballeronia]|uniref:DMT family transporter n=1 Tax=unclassified Caballeronia TaxID=2646786 RepID=UPI00285DDBE9|nr:MULTISPECIES: DMT family transporter [unclassified Caballeronia]MDR5883418.1 DMT family transporter [Caballeronia sp. LZ032]
MPDAADRHGQAWGIAWMSASGKGLMLASLGAVLLSIDTLLLRLIRGDPFQMAFARGLLMLLAGGVVTLFRHGSGWRTVARGWAARAVIVCYGLSSVTFVLSAMMTNISNMLTLIATAPLWAALGAGVFFKDWPPRRTWIACACALLGVVTVVWPSFSTRATVGAGDALALATALLMAAALLLSRRSRGDLALAPAFGGLLAAVVLLPFIPPVAFPDCTRMLLMALEGAIVVPLALGMIAASARVLPAPQVGLFLLIETVLGPFWIWAFLGETPTRFAIIGGSVVVVSLAAHGAFALRAARKRARAARC